MRLRDLSPSALRGLVVAICMKVTIMGFLALRGVDFALRQYVAGAAFAPRLEGQPDTALMMTCLLPQLAFVFVTCDHLSSGLATQATSAMPRLGTHTRWAARRTLGLLAFSAAYVLVGNLVGAALLAAMGGGLPDGALAIFGSALPLELLASALLALLANVVALWLEPVMAMALVLGVHGGMLVFQAFLPLSSGLALAPWLPSARTVLAWHDVAGVAAGAPGMGIASSCALLAVLVLASAAVTLRSVSHCDIL